MIRISYISFGYSNLLNETELFILNHHVFGLDLVQFSDEQVDFLPILGNFIKTIRLKLLLFKLQIFILFLKVSKLVLKGSIVPLATFKFIDLRSQFWDEEVLVLWYWAGQHHWFWWRQHIPRNILGMSHLIYHKPTVSGGAHMNWWSWSSSCEDGICIFFFKGLLCSKAALRIRIVQGWSELRGYVLV